MKTGGGSSCPSAEDSSRFQTQRCNEELCPKNLKCDSSQDVVFVLDASGDPEVNFQQQLTLVSSFSKLASNKMRLGVVAYGKEVKILSRITSNRTQLAAISSYSPPSGGIRDVAKAEIIGRTLFADPSVDRSGS